MEKEGNVVMWKRSEEQNGMQYVSMISDGDAKTTSEIHKTNPYKDVIVKKHECINHVGKRFGKACRTLVQEKSNSKPRVTLGGRGYGKRKAETITKLQKYYTKAIRSNESVIAMRRAIQATLQHCSSTDTDPHHDLCPEGETPWCFFNRAKAMGLQPGKHEERIKTPLCAVVATELKPLACHQMTYLVGVSSKLLRMLTKAYIL